jgi:hypothetical protein
VGGLWNVQRIEQNVCHLLARLMTRFIACALMAITDSWNDVFQVCQEIHSYFIVLYNLCQTNTLLSHGMKSC